MLIVASNFSAEERNAEFKFHFMLHADKDAANKWVDLPIPFPEKSSKLRTADKVLNDPTGLKQLGLLAPHVRVQHLKHSEVARDVKKMEDLQPTREERTE